MKKIYYLVFIIGSLLLSINSCKIDNFPLPDAQVFGAIRDTVGGGLIETDLNTGSVISVYELGEFAANPLRKTWLIKQSGEYRNNLVFSNDYRFEFSSCNFFPMIRHHVIKPGNNEIDFVVEPYIRIKNVSITHDAVGNKINASFTLEGGRPTVQVGSVTLYAWSDMYVGAYVKKTLAAGTGTPSRSFTGAARNIDPATVYTLSIDLAANQSTDKNGFGVHRNYYFRIGAITVQSGIDTIRSNYTPYVVIAL